MRKRFFALLLAAATLLGLAACGGKQENNKMAQGGEPDSGPTLLSGVSYTAQQVDWSSDLNWLMACCVSGDYAFLAGTATGARGDEDVLRRLSLEGGAAEPLPAYQPLDFSETDQYPLLSINRVHKGAEGTVWVWEKYTLLTAGKTVHALRQLDGEGKELFCFADGNLARTLGVSQICGLMADGDGDIFAATEKGISVLDPAGELRFSLELSGMDSGHQALVALGGGQVGVSGEAGGPGTGYSTRLRTIDKEEKDWGESYDLGLGHTAAYGGMGDVLFCYTSGATLFAWRDGAGEGEAVLDWMSTGADGASALCLSLLEDGRLAVMNRGNGLSAAGAGLYLLSPAGEGGLPERTVLTYGTMDLLGDERAAILAFNNTSPDYVIEVKDYAVYNTAEDRTAGWTRLATEVSAGNVPDILNVDQLGVARWEARGLFEDLWPYIDSDPDLSREDLMERVFQALETDGHLYQIASGFSIVTLTGARSVVGGEMTWTPEAFWAALETMPEGCIPLRDSAKGAMLLRLLTLDGGRFVDWENGACHFDSKEFLSLLEFCGSFPDGPEASVNEDGARLYSGQQMLYESSLTGFQTIQEIKFLLGGEVTFVGYPNAWGETGSAFRTSGSCAMSSACKDKAGAWSFLRTLLLPREAPDTYSSLNNFPTNRVDFERMAEAAMTPKNLDSGGKEFATEYIWLGSVDGLELRCPIYATTQEEYDQIMALYHATDKLYRWDQSIADIVSEEAGACFAGDRSPEEAAAMIQSRVSIYVNEQM